MSYGRDLRQDEKGLSARYLALVFLMGVAACAVFFSLGFLVGYNARPSRGGAVTEQVAPPPVIPPTVNRPLEGIQATLKGPASVPTPTSVPVETAEEALARPAPESKPAAASPTPRAPAAEESGEVASGFAVQVAASRDSRDAERLVKELKSRGYAVFVVTPEYADTSDNLFRVQVGPFATREEAEKVRDELVKEGFKPFIKR